MSLPLFEEFTTLKILSSDCEEILDPAGSTSLYQYGATVPVKLTPGEPPHLLVTCTIIYWHSTLEEPWTYSAGFSFGPERIASGETLTLSDAGLVMIDGTTVTGYYEEGSEIKSYEYPWGQVSISHGVPFADELTETFFLDGGGVATTAFGSGFASLPTEFDSGAWPDGLWSPRTHDAYDESSPGTLFGWLHRHGHGRLHESGANHAAIEGFSTERYDYTGAAYLVSTAEHLDGVVYLDEVAEHTVNGLLTTTIGYGPLGFMGDLDGDGLDDLYSASAGCSITGPLAVPNLVIITADTLRDVELTDTSIADVRLCGSSGSLGDEHLVAAPGDLDGDGYAELAYATPDADTASEKWTGRAYLLRGDTWREGGYADLSDADVRIISTRENGMVGAGLSEVADQDGDGVMELAMSGGYPADDRVNGLIIAWSGRDLPASGTLVPEDADVQLGGWLRSEGGLHSTLGDNYLDGRFDLTGDGSPDLLLDFRTGTSLILEDWWILAE